MAKLTLFLAACGGLFVAWHKGSKAVRVASPSHSLIVLANQVEAELGPLVRSKSLSVALLDEGKVVHTWRFAIQGGKDLDWLVAKVKKAVRRAGARLIAVSRLEPTGEVSFLVLPSETERCVLVLRPGPAERRFALALIVEPKSSNIEKIAPLAGVHLPLTFLFDLRSPGAFEAAQWLFGQGYEVAARGALHPLMLPLPFSGLFVEGASSPEFVKAAMERSLYLVFLEGRIPKGVTAVSLDVEVEGDSFDIRKGLAKLLNLAKRKGRAVGLVRLSADSDEVATLIEILREWAIKGVVLKTAGEVAKEASQLER